MFLAAATLVLFTGCKKDSGNENTSEVGKWYGFNMVENAPDKNDVAFVLDLKSDKSVDFIISAWGERYQGTYTYDGAVVTISYNKYITRPNAVAYEEAYGESPCAPANLYKHWVEGEGSGTLEIKFTYTGNTGEINRANKPCYAERQ